MNEAIESTLNTALIELISSAAQAKEFLVKETPDVIQQLLTWKVFESYTWLALSAFMTAMLFVNLLMMLRYHKNHEGYFRNAEGVTVPWLLLTVFWVVVQFLTDCFATEYILTIIKINVAPKLYLLEYAAELI